jgi:hypothetical protein
VQCLDDLVELLVLSFAVVFDQLHQIAVLEVAAHPIAFLAVLQDAMGLEDVVFELADVQVAVFEHLLAHAV